VAFFFASEINRRSSNEDSYCQMEFRMNAEAAVRAMVVADGMGGLSGGKYYSEAAVNMWYQELLATMMSERFRGNPLDRQIEILQEFSEEIYSKLNQRFRCRNERWNYVILCHPFLGYGYRIKLWRQSGVPY